MSKVQHGTVNMVIIPTVDCQDGCLSDMHISLMFVRKHVLIHFYRHIFFYLEVEHVSYHWAETWVDLQSNLILVNIAACLHWDWRAASSLHVFHCRRKEACVEMQSGCCQCSSAHTHIRTCVLVKCSSTRCFRFIIILLLCWQLYNSPSFEVISFCICYEENLYIYRKKIVYIHYIDCFMRIKRSHHCNCQVIVKCLFLIGMGSEMCN